jgi:hypothetical protein
MQLGQALCSIGSLGNVVSSQHAGNGQQKKKKQQQQFPLLNEPASTFSSWPAVSAHYCHQAQWHTTAIMTNSSSSSSTCMSEVCASLVSVCIMQTAHLAMAYGPHCHHQPGPAQVVTSSPNCQHFLI